MNNEQTRIFLLQARITPAERDRIRAEAHRRGLTVSGLVRQAMRPILVGAGDPQRGEKGHERR